MANYAEIIDGRIAQVAIGFPAAPFPGAVEISDDIAADPDNYRQEGGQLIYSPRPVTPPVIIEPAPEVDEEKVALAEAVIELTMALDAQAAQITAQEQRITTLEGGTPSA